MNTTISAVMFVYNEGQYIQEMIDSLIKQTVKITEIIIVDDFSTDSTKEIILENVKKHPFVRYYLNDKKGKVYAYIKGLSLVNTDYFFICAGDDVLMDIYVQENLFYLKNQKADFVLNNFYTCDKDLKILSVNLKKKPYYTISELILKNYAGGYLFGKKDILKVILPMPEDLLFEDWYNNIKLSYFNGKLSVNPTPLFYYRRHKGATTVNEKLTKEKYILLVRRDIRLFEILLRENFILDSKLISQVQCRLKYLRAMEKPSIFRIISVILASGVTFKEKFRIIAFPIFFNLKYS